jgi:hypothetical protein
MQLACPPRSGLGIILFGPIKFVNKLLTQQIEDARMLAFLVTEALSIPA